MNLLELFRPRRRKTVPRVILAASLVIFITAWSGCHRSGVEREANPSPALASDEENEAPLDAAPLPTNPEPTETVQNLSPPTVDQLIDPARSPYHHNPVSWRYLTTHSGADELISDAWVAMTTTAQRTTVDGVGLLFKLVVEHQGAGPNSAERGEVVETRFESFFALLTPSGLFLSHTSSPEETFEGREEELTQTLLARSPDWPLPGTPGCESESRAVELPFGQTQALVTSCAELTFNGGLAQVTTMWIDRVGFAYRQVIPLDEAAAGTVASQVLIEGDLLELAPPAIGSDIEHVTPQN